MWIQQFLVRPHRSRVWKETCKWEIYIKEGDKSFLMQTHCSTWCPQRLDASSTLHGVAAVSQANHFTFYRQKAMSEILLWYCWGWQTIAQGYGCYLSSGLWNSKPASVFWGEKWATVNLSDPSQEWQEAAGDGGDACIFYKQPQPPHSGLFS